MQRSTLKLVLCMTCGIVSFLSVFTLYYFEITSAFPPSNSPSIETPSDIPSSSTQPPSNLSLPPDELFSATLPTPETFLTYENSTQGLKIQYPADWDTYTQADPMYSSGHYVIGFISPDKTSSLNIETEDSAKDPEEYAKQYDGLKEIQIVDSESGPRDLNGNPAYELVYTSNSQDTKIKHLFEKVGDKLYYITYSSSAEKYSDYSPIAQKMIDSLELK